MFNDTAMNAVICARPRRGAKNAASNFQGGHKTEQRLPICAKKEAIPSQNGAWKNVQKQPSFGRLLLLKLPSLRVGLVPAARFGPDGYFQKSSTFYEVGYFCAGASAA